MARVNLLGTGTTGVDLRANPLFLGNAKVRFATNIQFHEGVAKTRPGFSARTLGRSGTLQGFCRYAPSNGLSSQVFGPAKSGIAFVIDGDIFFNDGSNTAQVTIDKPFCKLGAVNLFQAENWLIAQNPAGTTIMWDGYSSPIRSKGMNEVHWNNPETPWHEALPVNPVADIPDCDPAPQPWKVVVTVREAISETLIQFPIYSVDRLANTIFSGMGDAQGVFEFSPNERRYLIKVTKKGYNTTEEYHTFRRPRNAESRDDCYSVDAADRVIRLTIYLTLFSPGSVTAPVPGP